MSSVEEAEAAAAAAAAAGIEVGNEPPPLPPPAEFPSPLGMQNPEISKEEASAVMVGVAYPKVGDVGDTATSPIASPAFAPPLNIQNEMMPSLSAPVTVPVAVPAQSAAVPAQPATVSTVTMPAVTMPAVTTPAPVAMPAPVTMSAPLTVPVPAPTHALPGGGLPAQSPSAPVATDLGENPICKICQKGDDGRAMIRFLQTPTQEEVILHVFCGRTAAILPNINMPHYEILPKAGIKNKHGIGPDVNFALAQSRHAIIPGSDDGNGQPKAFYLVKEFEEHLSALKVAHGERTTLGRTNTAAARAARAARAAASAVAAAAVTSKPRAAKASSKKVQKPRPGQVSTAVTKTTADVSTEGYTFVHDVQSVPDGKVRCRCGGTHWPTGTPKGAASWRAHIMSKRHQQWMSKNC